MQNLIFGVGFQLVFFAVFVLDDPVFKAFLAHCRCVQWLKCNYFALAIAVNQAVRATVQIHR